MEAPRLKEKYYGEIVSKLREEFGYENVMQVPRLKKICLSQGLGAAVADKKMVDNAMEEMTPLPVKKPLQPNLKKTSQTSNFVRECRLAFE